jgi:hypothetical protein
VLISPFLAADLLTSPFGLVVASEICVQTARRVNRINSKWSIPFRTREGHLCRSNVKHGCEDRRDR